VDEYSLADLVEVTGAKRRSLQIWADRGVIHPIKSTANAGTGVHRLFSRKEAIIACIIHPFALRQIAIGELLSISKLMRMYLSDTSEPIEKAIRGAGTTMLSVESYYEGGKNLHWVDISGGGGPWIRFGEALKPGAFCMAIRLETYLAKLK
jgi:hypothetical protein